jgi:hypothetical protein
MVGVGGTLTVGLGVGGTLTVGVGVGGTLTVGVGDRLGAPGTVVSVKVQVSV